MNNQEWDEYQRIFKKQMMWSAIALGVSIISIIFCVYLFFITT